MGQKSIGIVTYMLSNYGAVLQCYALQRYLRNNSTNKVEVIDFTTDDHLDSIRILRRQSDNPIKNVILLLLQLSHYFPLKRRQRRTIDFKKRNINYTSRYSDMKSILENPPKEDVYVTGSDQVFNLNSKYVDFYYLNFDTGKARKVAYAPSFGVSIFDNEYYNRVAGYINGFDALSCREYTGARFLSELTGSHVPVVIDPTMLLTADEWLRVATKPKTDNYILIYDLNGREDLIIIAKKIQSITRRRIVCLTSNIRNRYNVDRIVYDAGPSEFVGWLVNAYCIVTDSFHGTSFALIFNKPFSTYIANPQTADRVRSLLKAFDLQSRIVENGKTDSFAFSEDFSQRPNARIADKVRDSHRFIKDNILSI